MAKYLCLAKDGKGNNVEIIEESPSEPELVGRLRRRGLIPISITPHQSAQANPAQEKKVFYFLAEFLRLTWRFFSAS